MDFLLRIISAEFHVIKRAPVTFGAGIVLVSLGVWVALSWNYARQLETKDATIELQKTQLEEYTRRFEVASPDEAKERIFKLQAQIAALKAKEAERTAKEWPPLTSEQIDAWVEKLSSDKGMVERLTISHGGSPSSALRSTLRIVFARAGWPTPYEEKNEGSKIGIIVSSGVRPNYGARDLTTLFSGLGHEVQPYRFADRISFSPSDIEIIIGHKPQD